MALIFKWLLPICLVFCGAGCCVTPSKAEFAAADFGSFPPDYQSQVKNYFSDKVKDNSSARYEFGSPFKAAIFKGLLNGGGYYYGYGFPVSIFTKNPHGDYTLQMDCVVFLSQGQVRLAETLDSGRLKRAD